MSSSALRSSSSKKRVLTPHGDDNSKDNNDDDRKEPPVRRSRPNLLTTPSPLSPSYDLTFESKMAPLQVKALQQQLDHERSLRALDTKKAQQTQQRLERQIQFAVDEANEYKIMLSDFQQESEKHTAELQGDRDKTLKQLRECQYQLHRLEQAASLQHTLAQEKQSKILLERKLESKSQQVDQLQEDIVDLKNKLQEVLKRKEEEAAPNPDALPGASSPAPKAVLRELNEVRIQLAESQRQYRQLQRATQNWHDQAKLYVKEREISRSATTRVTTLEEQLRQSQVSLERLQAEHAAWKEFSKTLRQQLQLDQPSAERVEEIDDNDEQQQQQLLQGDERLGGPPEVATILRYAKASQQRLTNLQEENSQIKSRLENAEKELESFREKLQQSEAKEARFESERKQLQQQLDYSKREIQTLQAKESIWKREADSLRALMQTYEDFPLPGGGGSASGNSGPKISSLELNISSLQEELKLVKEEKNQLVEDKNAITAERNGQQQELDRLQTKLAKIQAALITERHKVHEAEERACKSEALAGKGSFNPEESRALHLQRNPFTEALRAKYEAEIQALRKQLTNSAMGSTTLDEGVNVSMSYSPVASATSSAAAAASAETPQLDPGKLHQRLKDQFTEHAALFREAVYLVTGFKVDMLAGRSRPTFRVRSVYAEQEQDELIFMWPKKEKDATTSLDLMDTPFAKSLSSTHAYEYMTKFKSLPAFMASVQLSLFETTTLNV